MQSALFDFKIRTWNYWVWKHIFKNFLFLITCNQHHEKWRHSQGLPVQKNLAALQKATLIDGKPHRYPTGPVLPQANWELELGEQRRSGTLKLVQCHFRITTFPQSDGSVRIRLTPEIHHGAKKPRIAVSDDSFFWEPSQDKQMFHELSINADLRTGQTGSS